MMYTLIEYFIYFLRLTWNYIFYILSHVFWFSSEKEHQIHQCFFKTHRSMCLSSENNDYTHSPINLCTWNIHKGFDSKRNYRLLDISNYLTYHDFDIVCLQEVSNDECLIDTHTVNQSSFLAKTLGYYYFTYKETCILSKYPIQHVNTNTTNFFKKTYGNHYLHCKIILPSTSIHLFNCHLNNDLFGYEQYEFIRTMIVPELNKYNELHQDIILCGDFNSVSWFKGIRYLRSQLNYETKPKLVQYFRNKSTFPTSNAFLKLDKIYSNQKKIKNNISFIEEYVDYCNTMSDHHPLIARFSYKTLDTS